MPTRGNSNSKAANLRKAAADTSQTNSVEASALQTPAAETNSGDTAALQTVAVETNSVDAAALQTPLQALPPFDDSNDEGSSEGCSVYTDLSSDDFERILELNSSELEAELARVGSPHLSKIAATLSSDNDDHTSVYQALVIIGLVLKKGIFSAAAALERQTQREARLAEAAQAQQDLIDKTLAAQSKSQEKLVADAVAEALATQKKEFMAMMANNTGSQYPHPGAAASPPAYFI